MYSTIRYHLTISKKRTTISMDKTISDLIAIKLGFTATSKDTHAAIRKQLEKLILPYYDPKSPYYNLYLINYSLTQFVTQQVILWLVGEELTGKYYEYKVKSFEG
jgi:hypothetical protein